MSDFFKFKHFFAFDHRETMKLFSRSARRSFKVFLIMGGLFLIDLVLYFSGFYKKSSYWKLPVETVCRMGIALACAWVFICNEKVKGQLVEKFPRGIGRLLLRFK